MNMYTSRMHQVRTQFQKSGVEAFLVSKPENIFYLTGFRGEDSWLLITSTDRFIISDSRFKGELRSAKLGATIIIREKGETLSDMILRCLKGKRISFIGFEPSHVSYTLYASLRKKLKNKKLKPCMRLVESVRIIKDATEIEAIQEAIRIAEESFLKCISKSCIGLTEKFVSDNLEYTMKKAGGKGASFPLIVAAGARSQFPHAVSGPTIIQNNKALLIDFGAQYAGYCSDLTRTCVLGRIPERFSRYFSLVSEAQALAIQAIKPGVRIGSVDELVRQFFKRHNVEKLFTHSLGHGIGLEVHENPSLIYSNTDVFKEHMVVTVEPGLYLRSWGGIRIEDMVRVTQTGCEKITSLPTEIHIR